MRLKLSTSAGSGNSIFIVSGRSSSVRSFCTRSCAGVVFGFFFAAASWFCFSDQICRHGPSSHHRQCHGAAHVRGSVTIRGRWGAGGPGGDGRQAADVCAELGARLRVRKRPKDVCVRSRSAQPARGRKAVAFRGVGWREGAASALILARGACAHLDHAVGSLCGVRPVEVRVSGGVEVATGAGDKGEG